MGRKLLAIWRFYVKMWTTGLLDLACGSVIITIINFVFISANLFVCLLFSIFTLILLSLSVLAVTLLHKLGREMIYFLDDVSNSPPTGREIRGVVMTIIFGREERRALYYVPKPTNSSDEVVQWERDGF